MSERDPRVSPAVGDSIVRDIPQAKGGSILRDVTRAHGGFVFFWQDNGYAARPRIVTLTKWRKWAKDAEVITRAEDAQR